MRTPVASVGTVAGHLLWLVAVVCISWMIADRAGIAVNLLLLVVTISLALAALLWRLASRVMRAIIVCGDRSQAGELPNVFD